MERDPTGMATHYFQDHDAFVTGRGGVQTIERIRRRGDGGIEAESHGRRFEIVVDSFWNTDAIDLGCLQLQGGGHRAITTDDDERSYSQTIEHATRLCDDLGGDDGAIARANFGDE